MKKIFLLILTCLSVQSGHAFTFKQDTIRGSVKSTVESLYNTFIPMLNRIEISGNSEVSNELRKRWNDAVNHLKNNKGQISEDVLRLMVSPSGQVIDLELIKKFINITGEDSVKKISINPDFLLDELKVLSRKLTEESIKMAEQK